MHQTVSRTTSSFRLVHAVAIGAVCGLLAIVQSISYGSLLLPAGGPSFAAISIGMALLASTVMAVVTPLLSSTRGVIAVTQGVPVVALASVLGPVAAHLTGEPDAVRFATLVVATALTTIFIGLTSLALGSLHLGRFIRFAPFPVIGGFLAGSGWLILHGGLDLIAGQSVLQNPIAVLEEPSLLPKAGLAVAFIVAVAALGRITKTRLVMPVTVLGALILFNFVVHLETISADTLRDGGHASSIAQACVPGFSVAVQ